MNIIHTPPYPVPMPAVGAAALPIAGAVLVGFAIKSIWDAIFD